MNKPKFIMMVGLPASGKSTYAKELSEKENAIIHSSDSIRKELYGDESIQGDNHKIFRLLHSRIKEDLKAGKNVIYDATNINSKRRRGFLTELNNIDCDKICVIVAIPYEECLRRNSLRDRKVPEEVIKKMYLNWNTPYWFEGWDYIEIYNSDSNCMFSSVMHWVNSYIDYEQDNPNHNLSLGEHCYRVGDILYEEDDNDDLYIAGMIHDCGKPFTKSFINSKGEETEAAHYYSHENVGAYNSLFINYPYNILKLDISILVNLHMQPHFWELEKTRLKYKNLWGDELYDKVMKLHEADKKAH